MTKQLIIISLMINVCVGMYVAKLYKHNQDLLEKNEYYRENIIATGGYTEIKKGIYQKVITNRLEKSGLNNYYNVYKNIIYPVYDPDNSYVTCEYGLQYMRLFKKYVRHNGIDIQSTDFRIVAVEDGTADIHYSPKYGDFVTIAHKDGFLSLYGHLSMIYVKRHQIVKKGQIIGIMGKSGDPKFCSGIHLHFIYAKKEDDTYKTLNIFANSRLITKYLSHERYEL
jgi:murein DD-endopeptidase MepM/ murein hydrolase activator NlpD